MRKDYLLFFFFPVALCMGLAWLMEADAWPLRFATLAPGIWPLALAALGGLASLALLLDMDKGQAKPDKDNERRGASYEEHEPALYRKQGGWGGQRAICNGCRERYLTKDLHIDHIHPQALGGGDEIENLQLLCANCNLRKGKGTMEELRDSLREDGIIH